MGEPKGDALHRSEPLRVIELGHAVRTAYCGYLFARLGAEIHKAVIGDRYPSAADHVEQRAAAFFLDRGKSVRQLESAPDSALSADVPSADVLLAGSSADVDAYLGVSSAVLRTEHRRVIVAIASVFGEGGKYRDLSGGEPEALALSGLMSMIGEPGREPLRLGGPQAEHAAALSLFTAITVALYQRERTGMGAEVKTSAVRSATYLDWKSHVYYADDGNILQRGSNNGPFVLTCADGFVGFYYRDEEWPAVKSLVGDPRLDDARFDTQLGRDRNRGELLEIMEAFSRRLTRDELYHRSQKLHIPAGPVLNLDELHDDPQLRARRFLRSEDAEGLGVATFPEAPWVVDGVRGGLR